MLAFLSTVLVLLATNALALDLGQDTMTESTNATKSSEDRADQLLRLANMQMQKLNPLLDYTNFEKAIDDYESLLNELAKNYSTMYTGE